MPSVPKLTPVSVAGALPFAVAELTAKADASCVVLLRSRLIVWPLGMAIEIGEPLFRAPFVELKVSVCVNGNANGNFNLGFGNGNANGNGSFRW